MRSLARPRLPTLLALLAALAVLPACGATVAPPGPSDPFVAHFPDEGPGTPTGTVPTTPPPVLPRAPLWREDELSFGRVAVWGSFPSDLDRYGSTLFATDADAIEWDGARVLAIDVSGPTPRFSPWHKSVLIPVTVLRDSTGASATLEAPIGFGAYLNDVEIVSDRLGFVLANAGGSDTFPTLSNLVVFDPTDGVIVQVVPLANPVSGIGPLYDSSGARVPGDAFLQSGAEGLEYVPRGNGGRLFVAMSNLVFGGPSFGAVKYPGTVQVFDVLSVEGPPVVPVPQAGFATATLLTRDQNPVAVTRLTATGGAERVLVTVAGTTAYDAQGRLVPATAASVEAYDAESLSLLGRFELGLSGLSACRPAVGTDAVGHAVGYFASSVTGEAYLLRLDGLLSATVDPTRIAVLRGPMNGIPVAPSASGGPAGNVVGIALSTDGRTLVVAAAGDYFTVPVTPGRLFALTLPSDVVADAAFARDLVPGTTNLASTAGRSLGACLIAAFHPDGPEVYVVVDGALDATTFLGGGPASLGTLRTYGRIR